MLCSEQARSGLVRCLFFFLSVSFCWGQSVGKKVAVFKYREEEEKSPLKRHFKCDSCHSMTHLRLFFCRHIVTVLHCTFLQALWWFVKNHQREKRKEEWDGGKKGRAVAAPSDMSLMLWPRYELVNSSLANTRTERCSAWWPVTCCHVGFCWAQDAVLKDRSRGDTLGPCEREEGGPGWLPWYLSSAVLHKYQISLRVLLAFHRTRADTQAGETHQSPEKCGWCQLQQHDEMHHSSFTFLLKYSRKGSFSPL